MPMFIFLSFDSFTLFLVDFSAYEPLIVPYSNHTDVCDPLAFTSPVNHAEFDVTLFDGPVITVGTPLPGDKVKMYPFPLT